MSPPRKKQLQIFLSRLSRPRQLISIKQRTYFYRDTLYTLCSSLRVLVQWAHTCTRCMQAQPRKAFLFRDERRRRCRISDKHEQHACLRKISRMSMHTRSREPQRRTYVRTGTQVHGCVARVERSLVHVLSATATSRRITGHRVRSNYCLPTRSAEREKNNCRHYDRNERTWRAQPARLMLALAAPIYRD